MYSNSHLDIGRGIQQLVRTGESQGTGSNLTASSVSWLSVRSRETVVLWDRSNVRFVVLVWRLWPPLQVVEPILTTYSPFFL